VYQSYPSSRNAAGAPEHLEKLTLGSIAPGDGKKNIKKTCFDAVLKY